MAEKKKKLVVVESPTKARTIRKFLSSDYVVESCMGHIRDLPRSKNELPEKYRKEKWAHFGVNVDKNFKPIYCVSKSRSKKLSFLKSKLKEVKEFILATDEDREGESISWHLVEVLKPKIEVKRIVFHEITKTAIDRALKEFRSINQNLVRAQEARRILDRLVGYTLSPLIWKKIAYGLSAGRVQSVALQLMTERERERIHFIKTNYFSLSALFSKSKIEKQELEHLRSQNLMDFKEVTQEAFESKLYSYRGQKIAIGSDFDGSTGKLIENQKLKKNEKEIFHLLEDTAQDFLLQLKDQKFFVSDIKEKSFLRKPDPPLITSTLQQEANRKLHFTSKKTMDLAQKLYEKGLITYMRTDATTLSKEALNSIRELIKKKFGEAFLPKHSRNYDIKKVKGAQEAHEAIRPAGVHIFSPNPHSIEGDELELYKLIWKRTIASQMKDAEYLQVQVKISSGPFVFSASGQTLEKIGFLKLYLSQSKGVEKESETKKGERDIRLPKLKKGEEVFPIQFKSNPHETKPPPRFSEAYLVQVMEKNGIGRPSTYSSIINTIEQRGYVKRQGKALAPTFVSFAVSNLLSQHLPNYVDVEFTSKMEESLDDIARGDLIAEEYLKNIYFGKKGLKAEVMKREKEIQTEESRRIFFKTMPDLNFRIGRYGAYVCRLEKKNLSLEKPNGKSNTHLEETDEKEFHEVCASIPEHLLPGDMTEAIVHRLIDQKIKGVDALGVDQKTGQKVYVLTGRFGPYIQLGEVEPLEASKKTKNRKKKKGKKVLKGDEDFNSEQKIKQQFRSKRVSIPSGINPEDLTIEKALELLSFPKLLGRHPETQKEIKAGFGRFGPYVVCENDFRSIPKSKSIFSIQLEEALELFNEPKKKKGRSKKEVLKEWEVEEKVGKKKMSLLKGPYGPYIKYGNINVSLPDPIKPESVSLKQALSLVKEKKEKNKKA